MLPRLTSVVPVETKLGQDAGHVVRLLLFKFDPDPCADNLGGRKEARGILAHEREKFLGWQAAIVPAQRKVNLGQGFVAEWFGTIQEP